MFRHELTFLSGGECDGGGVKPIGDRSGPKQKTTV